MRRLFPMLLLLLLAACGGPKSDGVQLNVFAAASLQEPLSEIGAAYEQAHPGVALVFHFDSSGTLKTQIQEGAECDLFLSAGQKQMDQLDVTAGPDANPEGLDFVDPETRFDLLENKVVLAVPAGNHLNLQSFENLKTALETGDVLLAIGNRDVPVGQYTQRIFDYYGLNEDALAHCLTYGSNAKEVTTQVSEGTVDAGILYATDAAAAALEIAGTATPEMCGRVIYPAAVMTCGTNQGAAKDFLDFLRAGAAKEVFERAGFTPLG